MILKKIHFVTVQKIATWDGVGSLLPLLRYSGKSGLLRGFSHSRQPKSINALTLDQFDAGKEKS
jgi:hypothetical protein